MSASNERTRPVSRPPGTAGRLRADGRRVYRLGTPLLIWWTWVGLLLLSLADLAIQGHDLLSLRFALGLLTATGLVFACTLWPNVTADDEGILVRNPFRAFRIRWGGVKGIFLADSVEVQCARGGQKKDKTVYSWALSSPRRARARARLRGSLWDQGKRGRPSSYDRLPNQARELAKVTPAEIMARELAGLLDDYRARQARSAGSSAAPEPAYAAEPADATAQAGLDAYASGDQAAAGGERYGGAADVLSATWAWPPLLAILVPGVAFALAQLIG